MPASSLSAGSGGRALPKLLPWFKFHLQPSSLPSKASGQHVCCALAMARCTLASEAATLWPDVRFHTETVQAQPHVPCCCCCSGALEDWSKQRVVSVTAAYSFPSCSTGRTDLLIFYQQKSDELVWQLLIGKSGHNTTVCSHLLEKWFWWRLWERKPENSYQPLLFICSSGRLPKDCMAMGELHLLTTWASNLICACCCIVIFKQEPLTERSITQNYLML